MPTNPTKDMGSGKHWTAAELEAREQAAEELERETRIYMRVPEWLSEDAKTIWRSTIKKLRGIELLDNLDTEMLAVYCDAVANYQCESRQMKDLRLIDMPQLLTDKTKSVQAWARIISVYADKLGLSPQGRARLAKRKAEKTVDTFGEEFGQ